VDRPIYPFPHVVGHLVDPHMLLITLLTSSHVVDHLVIPPVVDRLALTPPVVDCLALNTPVVDCLALTPFVVDRVRVAEVHREHDQPGEPAPVWQQVGGGG
jgi:hypothetical protein